jgi:hypothetical protein
MGEQADFCRGLHTGTFPARFANRLDPDFRHILNRDRISATVGTAERKGGAGMDCCPICRDLERALELGLSEYIEARSSASFRVCTEFAAEKNVDMERARSALVEHRLVCVTAVRVLARLPQRVVQAGSKQLAA